MSKLVILLSMSGAVLAGSTVYLASELREEKARVREASSAFISMPTSRAVEQGLPAIQTSSTNLASGNVSGSPTEPDENAPGPEEYEYDPETWTKEKEAAWAARRKAQLEQMSRQFLRRYENPTEREKLVAEDKAARSQFSRRERIPGLSDADMDDIEDMQIRAMLAVRADDARCRLTPGCDPKQISREYPERHRLELAALLGPEKFRQYETFNNSAVGRGAVTQLRLKLGDANALSEADAQRLAIVLSDEWQKYRSEIEASGRSLATIGTLDGTFHSPRFTDGSGKWRLEIEPGIEFSKRLRKRATEVLSPAQQRVFDRMQDDLIIAVRAMQRDEELHARGWE